MKKTSTLIASFVFSSLCFAGPIDLLVKRIAPGQEKHFQFVLEHTKNQRNFFEVDANKQRIRIKGDAPISIACGLNWYLNEYAQTTYACNDSTWTLPANLPLPQERTYLNTYIQLGFSNYDPYRRWFWSWSDWEKEIDRIALSGINVYPVWVGMDLVWREFLSVYGLNDKEINNYLYNTDNIPEWWFRHQENLHKKIVRRLSNLGIAPVYPVFSGKVPEILIKGKNNISICPKLSAETIRRKETVISSDDPLFESMAKKWYSIYQRIFGSVPIYYGSTNGQPFASDIQKSLLQSRSDALWLIPTDQYVQQGWNNQDLDRNKVIFIYEDNGKATDWKNIDALKSLPWIWTGVKQIQNTQESVPLSETIYQPAIISNNPETASLIQGIGSNVGSSMDNPFAFTLIHHRRWKPDVYDLKEEVSHFVKTNFGKSDSALIHTWMLCTEQPQDYDPYYSFVCQRPNAQMLPSVASDSIQEVRSLQKTQFLIQRLLKHRNDLSKNILYQQELVRHTAHLLELKSRLVYRQIICDFIARDIASMHTSQQTFLQLITLADSVRCNHKDLDWYSQQTRADQQFSKKDTATTQWYLQMLRKEEQRKGSTPALSGILTNYCKPRWELFFSWMNQIAHGRRAVKPQYKELEKDIFSIEKKSQPSEDMLYQTIDRAIQIKTKCK